MRERKRQTFTLSQKTVKRLNDFCTERGYSYQKSTIVEKAINEFIYRKEVEDLKNGC